MNKVKPNIFDYATSELSQDAFLCWLLEWGNKKYENTNNLLYRISINFINKIFDLHKKEHIVIENILIKKQYKNIDILVIINDEIAIIIEDKTSSPINEDQLNGYYAQIESENKYSRDKILPVFFKPYNDFEIVQRKIDESSNKHKVLTREEFILLLEPIANDSSANLSIASDYYLHIKNIENDTNSYLNSYFENWSWEAWKGFYSQLHRAIKPEGWHYTPAGYGAAEGFLCFFWNYIRDSNFNQGYLYLQIEQDTLCIKHQFEGDNYNIIQDVKFGLHERIMDISQDNEILEVARPSTMRIGNTMTLAIIRAKNMPTYMVFEAEKINIIKTLAILKEAEEIVVKATKK